MTAGVQHYVMENDLVSPPRWDCMATADKALTLLCFNVVTLC